MYTKGSTDLQNNFYKCLIIPLATLLAVVGLMIALRVAAPDAAPPRTALAQVTGGSTISHTITGTVWNDENDNSVIDGGESGLTDTKVTVILYREYSGCVAAANTVTGVYTFTNVITGAYQIIEADGAPGGIVNKLNPTATFTATEVVTPCDPHDLANDPPGYASNTPNVQWITLTVGGEVQNRAEPSLWGALGTDLGTVDFGDEKATPFERCEDIFQTYGDSTGISLYTLDALNASLSIYPTGSTKDYLDINSIGFNRLDNFIYGYDMPSSHSGEGDDLLTRIDKNGKWTKLTATHEYINWNSYSGDINRQGYWVLGAANSSDLDIVDADSSRPTYLQVIKTLTIDRDNLGGADIAWNPTDDEFYVLDNDGKHFYRVNFDDSVEKATSAQRVLSATLTNGGAAGAQYFDKKGNFYFYVNNTGNLWKLRHDQMGAGSATPVTIATGSKVDYNDGCGCAPDVDFEFGDAPARYGSAQYNIVEGEGLYLGSSHDKEVDPQYSSNALGDDTDNTDDEDGVRLEGVDFYGQALGTRHGDSRDYTLTVEASKDSSYLQAWLDFDANGNWTDSKDHILTDTSLSAGTNSPMFTVTESDVITFFPPYTTFVRFRLSFDTGVGPTGRVFNDGEVEDYLVWLGGEADLSLTKTVVPTEPVHGGQVVTFTVVLTNSGHYSAAGVIVDDPLPTGYNYQTHTVNHGTYETPTGTWRIGTITHSTAITLVLVAEVRGGDLENVAEVIVSHNPDPDSTPNNHRPGEDDQASASVVLLPIGGTAHPANKLALLAPWVALAVVAVIGGGVLLIKTRRRIRRQ